MMQISGPKEGDAPITGAVEWVLANSGSAIWDNVTLRLVCGPAICPTVVQVPPAQPGQTAEIFLDHADVLEPTQLVYAMVGNDNDVFGELLHVTIAPPMAVAAPAGVVLVSPMDFANGPIPVHHYEAIVPEFTLANVGQVPWPKDTTIALFFNTPGFENLPTSIDVPKEVQPGQTVVVSIPMVIPETDRRELTAMWALQSASIPDFGDVVTLTFDVDDFPVLPPQPFDFVLPEEEEVKAVPEVKSAAPGLLKADMQVVYHEHHPAKEAEGASAEPENGIHSLGLVKRVDSGEPWAMQLVLRNSGTQPWPKNCTLKHVFGESLGVTHLEMEGEPVRPGECVQVVMELEATAQCEAAWVLTDPTTGIVLGPVIHIAIA